MTARSRTRNLESTIIGTFINFGSPVISSMDVGVREACEDHVGNYPSANPFSLYKRTRYFPVLNGTQYSGSTPIRQMIGFPLGYKTVAVPDPRTKFAFPSLVTLSNYAWQILAETNPSQPHVNLAAFTGELPELPSLVRGWGRNLIRQAARGYISWRWIVRPLAGDINRLVHFVEACNQRFTELRRLRDGKTIRKRVNLGRTQIVGAKQNVQLHSQGAAIGGRRQDVHTRKLWGSAEWKLLPNTEIPNLSDPELMKLTKRTMLGLNSHGALEAAWELLPWSWFIDWFSNVGTMLQASNNSIPLTWGRVCFMMETTSVAYIETGPADRPAWVDLVGRLELKGHRKDRVPVYPVIPVPLPYLPILDDGKLSILAALAALRATKP